ncbi:hypothetical protein QQF64_035757 [Cirrhinus molitorella]|uniref:Uncharacterized protein n=1 Tax=Cirrhinus molitorella TaxID=172907 RepID=A0ABR3NGM9_9TELE
MAFIKQESEDIKIVEVFSVKQEDTVEQTDLIALKEENEELKETEEKNQHEGNDFMAESEDIKIVEVFSLKQEDTEEQTDLMALKEENEELKETEEKNLHERHDFMAAAPPSSACDSAEERRKCPNTEKLLVKQLRST